MLRNSERHHRVPLLTLELRGRGGHRLLEVALVEGVVVRRGTDGMYQDRTRVHVSLEARLEDPVATAGHALLVVPHTGDGVEGDADAVDAETDRTDLLRDDAGGDLRLAMTSPAKGGTAAGDLIAAKMESPQRQVVQPQAAGRTELVRADLGNASRTGALTASKSAVRDRGGDRIPNASDPLAELADGSDSALVREQLLRGAKVSAVDVVLDAGDRDDLLGDDRVEGGVEVEGAHGPDDGHLVLRRHDRGNEHEREQRDDGETQAASPVAGEGVALPAPEVTLHRWPPLVREIGVTNSVAGCAFVTNIVIRRPEVESVRSLLTLISFFNPGELIVLRLLLRVAPQYEKENPASIERGATKHE
ncbi:MAG: hypothetical protein A2542_01630 [Parcubacteria group bacterium RIFOXYD2_FULL_52_8]|nr:MAG: hypothetical protein A2542_01630 [Parcubacteria group bacterium RIFOXYD2_FULL_52_8]